MAKIIHFLIFDDSSLLLVCTICGRIGDLEDTDPFPKMYGCNSCYYAAELSVVPLSHYAIDFDVKPPKITVLPLTPDMDACDVYIDTLMPVKRP